MEIDVAIIGYGNVGKGAELAVLNQNDMKLSGIFTKRNPANVESEFNSDVFNLSELDSRKDEIDVAILCGGSADELPKRGPQYASMLNTVDSFDTHARIPEYRSAMNEASKRAGKISVISTGWDPGFFSMMRMLFESAIPEGETYTFWGPGVSQGHSNALKTIEGVEAAIQYTLPIESAIEKVRSGQMPKFKTDEKHQRCCYVVPGENAEREEILKNIVTMEHYFADYDTEVNFISKNFLEKEHNRMPHGGFVLRSGKTGENSQLMEFSLKLESNPEFTGSIMVAYARAAHRLNEEGEAGARTVFDIAPKYLYGGDIGEAIVNKL